MDLFSRYTKIDFIYDVQSETICKSFETIWLKQYQTPRSCLSDNGKQFNSINFKTLLEKYKITHITSAPYNPTGNSLVERSNREIGFVLRLMRGKGLNDLKKGIWRRFNCTSNSHTKYTPYEIYFRKSIFKNYDLGVNVKMEEIRQTNKRS
ncbi:IgE-binding protein, partial [Dictyocoela muelleri]